MTDRLYVRQPDGHYKEIKNVKDITFHKPPKPKIIRRTNTSVTISIPDCPESQKVIDDIIKMTKRRGAIPAKPLKRC